MRVKVNFRVNTTTGDVETFVVEDISTEIEPEHEATHDRLAYEVGKVVERRPRPDQIVGTAARDEITLAYPEVDETPAERDHERNRE